MSAGAKSGRLNLSDSVLAHMRTDFTRLSDALTVGEALAQLRSRPTEGRIIYLYVVDDGGRLVGVLPTRRLLMSALETRLSAIMVKDPYAVPRSATLYDASALFTRHRLLAFPIVDEERRVLGVIDVDLFTQEPRTDLDFARANDDLFQLIGVHLTDADQTSPWRSFRFRFPWLIANIAGGIAAAFLSGLFEAQLQRVVALALFIPVVLALAESVGIQSVSLALQMLRGQTPTLRSLGPKLGREILTGSMLGLASGLLVACVALAWLREIRVALCLLGGILGGVASAAVIGVAMPNLLRMFRREPEVAAGPIALATADMVTLLVYFNLARWLLG